MGGVAGLVQANVGLSVVLHNTQWVIGTHAHMLLLGGLAMLLFAVVYALLPMLTGLEVRSSRLVSGHFWAWLAGAVLMSYAMGQAGTRGMLRRTIYTNGDYQPQMAVALAGGLLLALGFACFLANLIATLGLRGVIDLFLPARRAPRPAEA